MSRSHVRAILCSAAAALALIRPLPLSAQPANEGTARAVAAFEQAEALLVAGRLGEACPLYEESYRLDPQLGVLLYLADCREQNGELASAYAWFLEARAVAERRGDERLHIATDRLARLAPRLSHLRVILPAADAATAGAPPELYLDGEPLPPRASSEPIPVDSGKHQLRVEARGRRPFVTEFELAGEGQRVDITVPSFEELTPAPDPLAPTPQRDARGAPPAAPFASPFAALDGTPSSALHDDTESGTLLRSRAAWALAGVGAAGVIAAGTLSIVATARYDSADPFCARSCTLGGRNTRDEARGLARAATLSGTVGLSALAGAALLWWTNRSSSEAHEASRVEPVLAADRADLRLGVRGRF